jgi:hypothetical protein
LERTLISNHVETITSVLSLIRGLDYRKEVISMANEKRKQFVEPELIKCVKRLDEVTMILTQYNDCIENNVD